MGLCFGLFVNIGEACFLSGRVRWRTWTLIIHSVYVCIACFMHLDIIQCSKLRVHDFKTCAPGRCTVSSNFRYTCIQARKIQLNMWSSSSVFLSQGGRKIEKNIQYFLEQVLPKSSSHEDDQNSICGRPHLFFWSSLTRGHTYFPSLCQYNKMCTC